MNPLDLVVDGVYTIQIKMMFKMKKVNQAFHVLRATLSSNKFLMMNLMMIVIFNFLILKKILYFNLPAINYVNQINYKYELYLILYFIYII